MSAVVCGKRSNSIFDELSGSNSKRIRCCSPTAALRFSPARSPSFDRDFESGLAHLRSLFPDMDQQFLERALEASSNDLDTAIRSLNDLRLESAETNLCIATSQSESGTETNVQPTEDYENHSSTNNLPPGGSEWVNVLVSEMMNAADVDDARARASRVLEVLEKSIMERVDTEKTQSSHKENLMLKEQVQVLLQENNILKRAVAFQHEHQKDYDGKVQEVQQLKQLVSQYQEQLRTLEINNYALSMHLKQAQQNSSIPGRFYPDIF